jgi:hypothetical protein
MTIRLSKSLLTLLVRVSAFFACLHAASTAGASTDPVFNPAVFQVLDNLHYKGLPETGPLGMVHCNIIYLHPPKGTEGDAAIPDEQTFKAKVHAQSVIPGPIVLDLEELNLTGAAGEKNINAFITLVQWTHETAPGSVVGYYGHGLFPNPPDKQHMAQALKIAKVVDAFFPSMYTFTDNRDGWKKKLEGLVKQAQEIAPGKPVYPYIWPQYHNGSKKAGQYLDGDYWAFQMQTAKSVGANGVVLWSSNNTFEADTWWPATVKFLSELAKSAKT